MSIPLPERGNYYRGLLVLIRRDQSISEQERELMIQFGQTLDFDKRFCEAAIDELMRNPHIKADPIRFTHKRTAESFLRDALRLALVDGELHPKELSWLKAIADANGVTREWFRKQIKRKQPVSVTSPHP
jgi:hypothetical protein